MKAALKQQMGRYTILKVNPFSKRKIKAGLNGKYLVKSGFDWMGNGVCVAPNYG
jgi:hypothetical protein